MIVEPMLKNTSNPLLHIADVSGSDMICKIELTLDETKAILHSLGRTMCKGNELTISMELEDKLAEVLNHYR